MPAEGRALLSQIEGLMEQFLALDYETPVKANVQDMLGQVRSGMQALDQQGAEMSDGVQPAAPEGPPKQEFKDYKDASDAAMKDKVLEPKADPAQADDEDPNDPDRKKRPRF